MDLGMSLAFFLAAAPAALAWGRGSAPSEVRSWLSLV